VFGLTIGQLILLPLSIALVIGLAIIVHLHPRLGVLLWLSTVAFVPFWLGLNFVVYFLPTSLVGILVLVAVRPAVPRLGGFDLIAAFFFISCLAPALSGGATQSTIFGILSQALLAYLLGRLLPVEVDPQWMYACVAIIFTAVAVLALAEFAFGWNPFVSLGPASDLHAKWGVLQGRGDLLRAEGAFGHSIALGSSLALAIPLTLAAPLNVRVRLTMVVVMLGGVAVTISRISMVCAALAVLLSVAFGKQGVPRQLKVGIVAVGAVVTAALAPYFFNIFAAAGSEAAGSADYRGSLTELIPDISLLGISSAAYRSATGELFFGRFQSIDSQLIYTGLTYGWFALGCVIILLIGAVVVVVRGRASAATIAVVAQIPALATVALITQYSMMFWFIAGLAMFSQVDHDRPSTIDDPRTDKAVSDGYARPGVE
jgi:hypothetical protein